MILKSLLAVVASLVVTGGSLGIANVPDEPTANNQTTVITAHTWVSTPGAAPVSDCGKSIDEIQSKTRFHILTPTVLPSGYLLRGIDDSAPGRIILKYAGGNTCDDVNNLSDGVIEIVIAFSPKGKIYAMDGEAFISSYAKKYERNHLHYDSFVTKSNLYVIGADAGQSADKRNVIRDDPVRVYVLDESGNTAYVVRAFLPFEQVLKIAESLS